MSTKILSHHFDFLGHSTETYDCDQLLMRNMRS